MLDNENKDRVFLIGVFLSFISGLGIIVYSLIQIYPDFFILGDEWIWFIIFFPAILIILGSFIAYYRNKNYGGVIVLMGSLVSLMGTSPLLYLPSFGGIIGAILIFIPKEKQEVETIKKKHIGTIITAFIIIAIVGFLLYMYISGPGPGPSHGIELADAYCSGGIVKIAIKNIGTTDIGADTIEIYRSSPVEEPGTPKICCDNPIVPGATQWYTDHTCGSKKSCVYRITPPVGRTITGTVYCT